MVDSHSRRRYLQAFGASVTASVSGCASRFTRQHTSESPSHTSTQPPLNFTSETKTTTTEKEIQSPTGVIPHSRVPQTLTNYTYARMGAADAPVTATIYGSWKCPHTQGFVTGHLQTLIKEFVRPGKVSLMFREVAYRNGEPFHGPDELTAAHAGLAVWNHAPTAYWRYFAYVMANQQRSTNRWATPARLLRLAKAAGVLNHEQIRTQIQKGAYSQELKQTMQRVRERGLSAVPRVVTRGQVTAPTVNASATMKQLRQALAKTG